MRRVTTLAAGLVALCLCVGCPRRTSDPGRPASRGGETARAEATPDGRAVAVAARVLPPARGCLYHGMHPGGPGGEEDVVLRQPELIDEYVADAGHAPAFVYFSHEWGHENDDDTRPMRSHAFPLAELERIARDGAVPFVRLMLRSQSDAAYEKKEKHFTLENIVGVNLNRERRAIHEQILKDLRAWGRDAREKYRKPLVVEWGTEVNNRTFHWNAQHQGRDKKKAAALFQKAFRLIAREVSGGRPELSNITWVFHVTAGDDPDEDWNRMADYFPDGTKDDPDNVVDWLGVSVYGVDNLDTGACEPFAKQLGDALGEPGGQGDEARLRALARRGGRDRPIFVLELGTAANYQPADGRANPCHPRTWTERAFMEMLRRAGEGELAGFSWWSERFPGQSEALIEMRVGEFKNLPGGGELLQVYRDGLRDARVAHAPKGTGGSEGCVLRTAGGTPVARF